MSLKHTPAQHLSLACVANLIIVVVLCGCGGGSVPDRPDTHPVSGVVLYNGDPVADAHVTFLAGEDSAAAYARTDNEGRFQLSTFGQGDGAVEGTHRVTVAKQSSAAAGGGDDVPPGGPGAAASPQVEHLLPERYADPETSGLEVTVGPGGDAEVTLELTG